MNLNKIIWNEDFPCRWNYIVLPVSGSCSRIYSYIAAVDSASHAGFALERSIDAMIKRWAKNKRLP